jgi:hypothetical protein
MEDCILLTPQQGALQLRCRFWYVEGTLQIWPPGAGRLSDVLHCLQSGRNIIQFTMESEADEHLSC